MPIRILPETKQSAERKARVRGLARPIPVTVIEPTPRIHDYALRDKRVFLSSVHAHLNAGEIVKHMVVYAKGLVTGNSDRVPLL